MVLLHEGENLLLKKQICKFKYFFTVSILFFLNVNLFSQGGYAVTKQISGTGYTCQIYDATNGLQTSDANYILGSKDGYVWICGYNGIIRYDGTTFERYPTSTGLTNGRAFFEDSKGRIWVGTNDNGVVVINGENTKHFTYKDGLPSSSIRNFAEDKYGNIFIATTAGLAYVNGNGLLYRFHDMRINEERILKLDTDSNGTIYGHSSNGIVFALEDGKITELYTSSDLQMNRITTLLADPLYEGKVYLCCEDGTIYYGDFGNKSFQMQKIDISPIKSVQWITYICNRVWLCSTNQIAYLDTDNKLNIVSNIPMTGSIEMITSDYQGNIWACSSAQGVMKIVANNFIDISKEADLPEKTVNTTCLHNGLLYIGTERGLHIVDKNRNEIKNSLTDYIADTRIRCIIEDKSNNLWIATYNNGKGLVCQSPDGKITSITTQDGLASNKTRVLKNSKDNSILCCTSDGFSIIKNQKVIKTIKQNDIIKNSFFLCVEEDEKGNIYLGSDGDGIYVVSGSNIKRIGRDEGLTSDIISRIKADKKNDVIWIVTGNSIQYIKNDKLFNVSTFPYNDDYDLFLNKDDTMWVLTSCGIFTTSVENLLSDSVTEYKLYTMANGLPSAVTSNSYSTIDENGNLYISCRNGVSCVNIDNYYLQNNQIKTNLKSIYCGTQKILPDEKGRYILPPSNERIKLTASVLDYTITNPFVHIFLEGSNDDGITIPRNELSSLEYTGLSYGDYTLHIQILSQNKKTILADKTFEIIKKPRFTELLFTRILFIFVLVIVISFVVWRIMKSTVISKQYKQIQTAKEEAETANSTKSRFLANMSQEIITPINTIMCMDEMILRENAENVPKNYFLSITNYGMNIRHASESLLNLINDLLEMTKIESGKLILTEIEYDIKDVLRSIIIPIHQKTLEKELNFSVSIDPLIPNRLYGDVGKIKQILLKLLSNALKYTDQGGIELSISMEGRSSEQCDLCIRVKDTGIGMKPDVIENIFDAYSAFEKKTKGFHFKTGLGLDISRRFAELMGGVLVCRSEEGIGSEFIFTLTQKVIKQTPIGVFSENEKIMQFGPYTPEFIAPDADILVASENIVNLNVLDSLLKATKVFVTRANSKQDFLIKIRENTFNVAFIDQLLFENDENEIGEMVAQIKQTDAKLPVYIFVEKASTEETFYKQKGFTGTLSLPVDSGLLERTIMRHLPQEMMQIPEKNTVIEDLKEFPEDLKWLNDIKELSIMDGIENSGGIGSFIFAIKLFLDTIDYNAEIIDNAYKNGNFELYRIRNGIIRNSARIVGLTQLFDFSSKMEEAFKHEDKIFIAANTDRLLNEYKSYKIKLAKLEQGESAQNV